MQADPLPPLRRGGREVRRADGEIGRSSIRMPLCCGRSDCTATLGIARRLALTGRLALARRLATRRLVALGAGVLTTNRRAAGFAAVGDIPARAFENNAHRLKDPSHCAGTGRTGPQRLVLEGLELLALRAACVTGVDIGRHNRSILLVVILVIYALLYMIYTS